VPGDTSSVAPLARVVRRRDVDAAVAHEDARRGRAQRRCHHDDHGQRAERRDGGGEDAYRHHIGHDLRGTPGRHRLDRLVNEQREQRPTRAAVGPVELEQRRQAAAQAARGIDAPRRVARRHPPDADPASEQHGGRAQRDQGGEGDDHEGAVSTAHRAQDDEGRGAGRDGDPEGDRVLDDVEVAPPSHGAHLTPDRLGGPRVVH
jgi:hypothetical protein